VIAQGLWKSLAQSDKSINFKDQNPSYSGCRVCSSSRGTLSTSIQAVPRHVSIPKRPPSGMLQGTIMSQRSGYPFQQNALLAITLHVRTLESSWISPLNTGHLLHVCCHVATQACFSAQLRMFKAAWCGMTYTGWSGCSRSLSSKTFWSASSLSSDAISRQAHAEAASR